MDRFEALGLPEGTAYLLILMVFKFQRFHLYRQSWTLGPTAQLQQWPFSPMPRGTGGNVYGGVVFGKMFRTRVEFKHIDRAGWTTVRWQSKTVIKYHSVK